MELEEKVYEDVVYIKPKGEVTIFYIDPLEELIQKRVSEGFYKFIFDLRDVNYIDSMGIGIIAIAGNAAKEKGTKIVAIVNNPKIEYTLSISRLQNILEIVKDRGIALQFFGLEVI